MSEKEKAQLNVFHWLVIAVSILGFLFYVVGSFLIQERFLLYLVGFFLVAASCYFSYKALEKISKNKQLIGGFWIALVISFFSFHFFSIIQAPDESSIHFLFRTFKGQSGKSTQANKDGIIEQFSPPKKARRDIKIIGIKTETIDKVQGQWPLHWKYYAQTIDLFQNSSNILFIDVFFLDPKPGQMELVENAAKGKPNVIVDYPIETSYGSKETIPDLSERQNILRKYKLKNVVDTEGAAWLLLAIPPVPSIARAVGGLGFANIRKEYGRPNRKMPLVTKLEKHGPNEETEYYPNIDLVALCKYYEVDVVEDTEVVMGRYVKIKNIPKKMITEIDLTTGNQIQRDLMAKPNMEREIVIPINEYGEMEINFEGGLYCFQDEELVEVAEEWTSEVLENYQKNIFLLAMYYATGSGTAEDTHLSPYGNMSGIEHHAHALNTVLNQNFLHHTTPFVNLMLFLVSGLAIAHFQSRYQVYVGFIALLVSVLGYFGIASYLFLQDWIVPLPSLLINLALVFVAITGYKILTEEENVKYIRNTFSKFVSQDVVNELLKDPNKIALGGARREITVFFSDVRGFTTLSEALTPEELVQLLNEYLSVMTDIIIELKGTIDKYMGDAIMAFWGAPVPLEEHAYYACVASVKQVLKLKELQENWKQRNLPSIDIGIGLNTGPAVVGNMGSSHRMDYTCMGDTVNLGSRLEGSNKMYGTKIIMSEYTYERVKDKVYARELDLVQVKGKTHPVRIYELLGLVNDEDMIKLIRPLSLAT